ncbi:MAG: prepilin-type N-terminal cleavage/methylation domain-containing protein [Venatoribacter sp.]
MSGLRKNKGFSLIEIVVVISIIGVLLMMGSSLSSSWVSSSHVGTASAAFKGAVSVARSAGLRNSNNKLTGEAAAGVCVTTTAINVVSFSSSAVPVCAAGNTTLIKAIAIPSGVTIKEKALNTSVSCLVFDSTGLLLPASGCLSALNKDLVVEKNNENIEFKLI